MDLKNIINITDEKKRRTLIKIKPIILEIYNSKNILLLTSILFFLILFFLSEKRIESVIFLSIIIIFYFLEKQIFDLINNNIYKISERVINDKINNNKAFFDKYKFINQRKKTFKKENIDNLAKFFKVKEEFKKEKNLPKQIEINQFTKNIFSFKNCDFNINKYKFDSLIMGEKEKIDENELNELNIIEYLNERENTFSWKENKNDLTKEPIIETKVKKESKREKFKKILFKYKFILLPFLIIMEIEHSYDLSLLLMLIPLLVIVIKKKENIDKNEKNKEERIKKVINEIKECRLLKDTDQKTIYTFEYNKMWSNKIDEKNYIFLFDGFNEFDLMFKENGTVSFHEKETRININNKIERFVNEKGKKIDILSKKNKRKQYLIEYMV